MPRTPSKFTRADIARAVPAIEHTGAKMEIRIDSYAGDILQSRSPGAKRPPLSF